MKKTILYFYVTLFFTMIMNAANAAIIFSFANPAAAANVCKATGYVLAIRDMPIGDFPLTITLNTVVKQGAIVVSLPPYAACGVGLSSSGVSPAQVVNEIITNNASCPSLAIASSTVNPGIYTWTIAATGCSGSISFDFKYDVILDCALIPQNFQNIQNLSMEQNCTIGGTSGSVSHNITSLVPLPHILNAPTITVAGNYGQTTDMIFEYQNNGTAPIDIVFGFEDKYLTNCTINPAYTVNYKTYAVAATQPLPGNIITPLITGIGNIKTIPALQNLYILQNVNIIGCFTNCPNDRKVELKWRCANNLQNYQFCSECQQEYVTQFVFSTEVPAFTVERIAPVLSDAEYNTQCFGDELEWEVKVTNTSQYTTLPNIRVHLQSASYGPAGLSIIYDNSVIQYAAGTNCPNCSFTKTPSLGNTSSACYNGSGLGNSYGAYDIDIGGMKHGEYLTFKFKTYKCCNPITALLGVNKSFNHWMVSSKATTICNTFINNPTPAASGNDLALSAAGNISSHLNTSDDIDLNLSFNPSYPSDFTVNTAQYSYMYSNPSTTNQKIEFGGMFGDNFDKQVLGYTAANPHVTGILKAQVNCGKGLVVCSPADITMEFTTGGGTVILTPIGYYFPNLPLTSSATNPNGCPSCVASNYNFYYSLTAIDAMGTTAIDDFYTTAKYKFNLTPCCSADPVTDYDVTFSLLPNTSCFNYTLPTGGADLVCTDAGIPGNGCCWLPLSKDGWHVNIHCPGCRAPGIIVDDYRMRRNSFGFPDVTNDRVADNTTEITLQPLVPTKHLLHLIRLTEMHLCMETS